MNNKESKEQYEKESEYAAHGHVVLNNPAYKEAFALRKAKIFEDFCSSKADETEKREEAWRSMQNMKALEQYFNHILQTGKLADHMLVEMNKLNS